MKELKLLSLLIFIFIIHNAFSQRNTQPCDSITKRAKSILNIEEAIKYSKNQLPFVDNNCKLILYDFIGAKYYESRKLDSSLVYYDKAIAIRESTNNIKKIANIYSLRGFLLTIKNQKEEAKNSLDKAKKILDNYPDSDNWQSYYSGRAKLADKNKEYEKAILFMDSTIVLYKRLKLESSLSTTYHNKGVYYLRLSNYEKAIESLMQALKIKEDNKMNPSTIANTLYLIGICNMRLKQPEKAIQKSKLTNSKYIRLLCYTEMGISARYLNNNDKAIQFLDSAQVIAKKSNDNARLSQIYKEKGMICLKNEKEFAKAEEFLTNAYTIGKTSSQHLVTVSSINGIIELYLKKKQYGKVKRYLEDLKETISHNDVAYSKEAMHKYYSEYYEHTGKPNLALQHLKKYHKIKDSISNSEVKAKVADLEKKYETQKKELAIANLTEEKKQQEFKIQKAETRKNLYLIATLFLLVALSLGVWAFIKLRKQRKELMTMNQVKNRFFSIIAHDLRGMILPFQRSGKILKHHIEKGNYDKTIVLSQALEANSERLSNTLDNLLNWSLKQLNGYKMNPVLLSVQEELKEIVSGYEQQARYKQIDIEIVAEEAIQIVFDKGAFHVIFRNLIGNALKYTEKGKIQISCQKKDGNLVCSVSDTGVGMTTEQLNSLFNIENKYTTKGTQGEQGSGLGLNLVHRFIEMNNGNIKVSSEKANGTQFELKIPTVIEPELDLN